MPETRRRGGRARRRQVGLGGRAWPARRSCFRQQPARPTACRRTSSAIISTRSLALERHEIAALALTLGVILFAVVTAIALLRTRARAAAGARQQAGRDQRAARGARPLRRSCSPSRRRSWSGPPAATSRTSGAIRRVVTHARGAAPHPRVRHLARARSRACAGPRRGRAARARRELRVHADDACRPIRRGRGPRDRRAGGAAHQGPDRRETRAGGAFRRAREAQARHRHGRDAARRATFADLGARCRRAPLLGQRRLCARGRCARRGGRGRAQPRTARRGGARRHRARARRGRALCGAAAGDRRRHAAHPRRGRPALARRQCRHGHRRHRDRGDAQRIDAHDRGASPHPRSALHRGRDLHGRTAALLLQHGLPGAVGPRRGIPRFRADRLGRARPPARRAQASRAGRLPQMEGRAARRLPRRASRARPNGTCRAAVRCASSRRRTRKAASPICSTT